MLDKGLIDSDGYPAKLATAISKVSIGFALSLINNFFTLPEKVTKRQCQQRKLDFSVDGSEYNVVADFLLFM